MNRAFRKYHRTLALIVALPLIFTVLSGMIYSILDKWVGKEELGETFLKIHTMEIIGLDGIYPFLNALGLIGMIVTGLSMTNLFRKRPERKPEGGDRDS